MMQLRNPLASAALMIVAVVPGVRAEGDVAAGMAFAQEWCARCHNIEADGPFKLHPPGFAAVAKFRSAEQVRARIIVPPLHSGMPGLSYYLTPESIDDVVAYIVSLDDQ